MVVAVIGTTLSAYIYTWQSNQEVEEEIAEGQHPAVAADRRHRRRTGRSRRDILIGMFFSNVVMYFIILSTGATLYQPGQHDIDTAAEAAEALRPARRRRRQALFALGIIGVGFLAVPVMTTGAAYDLAQSLGWRRSLHDDSRARRRASTCHRRGHRARRWRSTSSASTRCGRWSGPAWCRVSRRRRCCC